MLMKDFPLERYLPGVNALIYGCMGLGGGWNNNAVTAEDHRVARSVLDTALESDIRLFDHADIYTFGKAESVFGQAMSECNGLRDDIYLQSKCGIRFEDELGPKRYDFSASWLTQSVEGILSRLNTDYLDILLLHRPDPLVEFDELALTLRRLRESGKVRYFGVSNMHTQQIQLLQRYSEVPIVVNQLEMSLLQRDWLEETVHAGDCRGVGYHFSTGLLEHSQSHNVQLQSWGSLGRGVYSGANEKNADAVTSKTSALVAQMAHRYAVSSEAIVLAWLMRHPVAIQPIIGTANIERIKACCLATQVSLSREDWYALWVSARGDELP